MNYFIAEKREKVLRLAANELISSGISPLRLGYTYILGAVADIITDDSLMIGITKTLYPHLADRYCTSSQAVERNIRSAINSARKGCKIHVTNKEFIFKTVNRVKMRMEISNIDEY